MTKQIAREWLRERLSDSELAALDEGARGTYEGGRDAYEHGFTLRDTVGWASIKSQFTPGDEVWKYCSPMEIWQNYKGEMGIAIVRQGAVVASVVTFGPFNR
jgi:hypothetical protein